MLHITTTDNNCAKNLSELIDNSQENDDFSLSHYTELSQIANISLSELCEKNKNLIVFPDNATNNDNRISILDAKYKHLENGAGREDLYQVVSYIHTMSKPNENVLNGGFVFPCKNSNFDVTQSPQKPYKLSGLGGKINVIGFKIPQDAENFVDFCSEIKTAEEELIKNL